jgi:hypothetical protein
VAIRADFHPFAAIRVLARDSLIISCNMDATIAASGSCRAGIRFHAVRQIVDVG